MSRESSASLEIVPPTTSSRNKSLAATMDAAFKQNHKANEDDTRDYDDADADAEVDEIDDQPPAPPVQRAYASASSGTQPAAASSSPDAPTPCERCLRTNKVCKGLANSRCDYCKRLKQKCSNSTGPARGKHATKKTADSSATPKGAATKSAAGPSAIAQSSNNLKRKSPAKEAAPNGDVDGHSMDGEGSIVDEDNNLDPSAHRPVNKKRRIAKGPTRSQLVKAASDIDAAMKRIQSSVAKEVEKMSAIIGTLNAKIREMDEE